MIFFAPNHYRRSKLDVPLIGFFPLETTPPLGILPLGVGHSAARISCTQETVSRHSADGIFPTRNNSAARIFPTWSKPFRCWDFPYLEATVNYSAARISPTRMSNSTAGISPTRIFNSTAGISPTRRSGSPLCCWDFFYSELMHPICRLVIAPLQVLTEVMVLLMRFPHSEVTVNPTLLLGFSPLGGPDHHCVVGIFSLRVDASNLSMSDTPTLCIFQFVGNWRAYDCTRHMVYACRFSCLDYPSTY